MSLADQIIEHGPYRGGDRMTAVMAGVVDLTQINELRDELVAGRALKELLAGGRFNVYASLLRARGGAFLGLEHDGCPSRWYAELDDFTALAQLVQRAGEHAEVCG